MATKTYVRTGRIQWPMDDDELALYEAVDADMGESFDADLDEPTETWLLGHGVISLPPDVAVSLPVNGPSDGDLPTADGAGDYSWEAPAA